MFKNANLFKMYQLRFKKVVLCLHIFLHIINIKIKIILSSKKYSLKIYYKRWMVARDG